MTLVHWLRDLTDKGRSDTVYYARMSRFQICVNSKCRCPGVLQCLGPSRMTHPWWGIVWDLQLGRRYPQGPTSFSIMQQHYLLPKLAMPLWRILRGSLCSLTFTLCFDCILVTLVTGWQYYTFHTWPNTGLWLAFLDTTQFTHSPHHSHLSP